MGKKQQNRVQANGDGDSNREALLQQGYPTDEHGHERVPEPDYAASDASSDNPPLSKVRGGWAGREPAVGWVAGRQNTCECENGSRLS